MKGIREKYSLTERHACRIVGQPRGTQRYTTMTAKVVRSWLANLGAQTLYIEPGSPWENGYCESFKLRDECLNGEIFYSLKEATVVIEQWRKHYNTCRPHSSLGYRPPAPQTTAPEILRLDRNAVIQ